MSATGGAGDDVIAPDGTWPSPLTPALAAEGGPRFGDLTVGATEDGQAIVWFSTLEGGSQRVYRSVGGGRAELVEQVTSARSRVNEYGGGALWCHGATLFFVEDSDQCVYRLDPAGEGGGDASPTRLSQPGDTARAVRHASGTVEPGGRWMVVERELHVESGEELDEAINELAWMPTDGGVAETLWRGPDFVAAPRISPTGEVLAWLQWNHPDLPWDAAELWAARVREVEGEPALFDPRRIVGGSDVAACLPEWSPDGALWWCDDRADSWLLRHADGPGLPAEASGDVAAAVDHPDGHVGLDGDVGVDGDVGEPRWVSGGSRYGFVGGDVLLAETVAGLDRLHLAGGASRDSGPAGFDAAPEPGVEGLTWAPLVVCGGNTVAVVAGRATAPTSVMVSEGARWTDIHPGSWPTGKDSISAPEPITFPTGPNLTEVAHGLFYPPRLDGHRGTPAEKPPLVVRIHGGPTAHARAELSPSVQFWTTRGFAVVEVNHRGSTGFGRAYRGLLRGGWGQVEVQDCIAAADHLGWEGRVDPHRCVIRGGSAGGFTALEAVSSPPTESGFHFAAATTLYGVTDLMALAADTHKFESCYLDGLVGRLPEDRAVYEERSPIRHPERISVPVLVLQGLEDRVVPPEQAETLVAALEANGVPHEYRTYAGEGHGFRNAETVVDALEAELAFYQRVLGLTTG